MSKNEYRLYHQKKDLSWGLCDPVGKGGTRAASQYPHRDDQSNALKGHKSPSGHLGNPQAQNHAGSSKSQRN